MRDDSECRYRAWGWHDGGPDYKCTRQGKNYACIDSYSKVFMGSCPDRSKDKSYAEFAEYCKKDVEAEYQLHRTCDDYFKQNEVDPATVFVLIAAFLLLVLIVIGSCTVAVDAATLGLEQGAGMSLFAYETNDYSQSAVTLKTGEDVFTEYRLGMIDGGSVLSIAKGIETGGDLKFNASIGVAYLESVPIELTGHEQIIVTLGAEYQINKDYSLNLNLRHLSNGSKIFGHGRVPNRGVEAVFLGIGKEF